jgi:hypothetical protein
MYPSELGMARYFPDSHFAFSLNNVEQLGGESGQDL